MAESRKDLEKQQQQPVSLSMEHPINFSSSQVGKYLGFTKRQLVFLLTYGLYNIFRGALILIVGPFYPPEVNFIFLFDE